MTESRTITVQVQVQADGREQLAKRMRELGEALDGIGRALRDAAHAHECELFAERWEEEQDDAAGV